jgi:hypothetical protein
MFLPKKSRDDTCFKKIASKPESDRDRSDLMIAEIRSPGDNFLQAALCSYRLHSGGIKDPDAMVEMLPGRWGLRDAFILLQVQNTFSGCGMRDGACPSYPVFASGGGARWDHACAVAKLSAWNYGCSTTIIIIDGDVIRI